MEGQLETLSFMLEIKLWLIMNTGDNWSGADGGGKPLENTLTKNTGVEMDHAYLRTDS